MAFDPEPPAWTLNPVARNPFGYRTRRAPVMTGNPNISVTIPSPMTRDPNISATGGVDRAFQQ